MSERHTEPDARVEHISSVVTCKNPPVCLLTQLSPVSTIALRLVPVPTRFPTVTKRRHARPGGYTKMVEWSKDFYRRYY